MSGSLVRPKDIEDAPVYGSKVRGMPGTASSAAATDAANSIMDPAYAMTLGREIYTSSTDWINSSRRQAWSDSMRAFQGLHPTGSKYLSHDYRYRSRLFRPKTRSMVRKAEAQTASAFFSNEDVVSITAEDENDKMQQASAEIMQRLLQYRLTKTIPWFLTVVGARQDAEVTGICIGKVYWKFTEKYTNTESRVVQDPKTGMPVFDAMTGMPMVEDYDQYEKTEDHPCVDLIAGENFRFDPGADWRNPVGTSPYTIELIPMYIADVEQKIEDGEWLPVSTSSLFNARNLDDDTTRRAREQGRVPGKDNDAGKPKQFDICWIRENIVRHKGEEVHYLTLSGSGQLLTRPRPLREVYLQGIRPYVVGFVVPEAHKTHPSSKVELIRDLQTKANDVDNLRLDNVKLALNPRQIIASGQGVDPQDMRVFMPGKVITPTTTGNIRDSFMWDRPPEVTASSYQEQDRVDLDFTELVGGVNNASIQGNRQVYEAVGNMEMMQGNGALIEEYDQRVFAETWVEPVIRHLVKLEQAYETDPVILAMAGQQANLWMKYGINEITDFLLQQELTARVNVGIGATNPKTRLQNFAAGAKILSEVLGPAAVFGINAEEIIKEVFGQCGYKDGMRFFQPGFNFQQALQAMLQAKNGGKSEPEQALAQQEEAKRQTLQNQFDIYEKRIEHQYKLEEMESQKKAKEQETMMKLWFEMQKEQIKANAEQQNMTRMATLAEKPPAGITMQFNAEESLGRIGQNLEGMAGNHGRALEALQQILLPISEATQTMGQMMMATNEQMNRHAQVMEAMVGGNNRNSQALASAIDGLTRATTAPRRTRAERGPDGKLSHSISEVIMQ